jgi:hypothetical protein
MWRAKCRSDSVVNKPTTAAPRAKARRILDYTDTAFWNPRWRRRHMSASFMLCCLELILNRNETKEAEAELIKVIISFHLKYRRRINCHIHTKLNNFSCFLV